jgi:hypothetical protein
MPETEIVYWSPSKRDIWCAQNENPELLAEKISFFFFIELSRAPHFHTSSLFYYHTW